MSTNYSNFIVPKRQILSKDDLEKFKESQAYEDYISFIVRLNDSVKGLKLSDDCIVSAVKLIMFYIKTKDLFGFKC